MPTENAFEGRVFAVQLLTLCWMSVECSLALVASARARSPALLAFGSDSLIELLSAVLVLVSLGSRTAAMQRKIERAAGALLYLLAGVVVVLSSLSLLGGRMGGSRPDTSLLGIGVSVAALLMMPFLAWRKRKLAQRSGNLALAADAVQSATCAYLALVTLAGLALNAVAHLAWADSVAALAAVPLLVLEGRRTRRGQGCGCCH